MSSPPVFFLSSDQAFKVRKLDRKSIAHHGPSGNELKSMDARWGTAAEAAEAARTDSFYLPAKDSFFTPGPSENKVVTNAAADAALSLEEVIARPMVP